MRQVRLFEEHFSPAETVTFMEDIVPRLPGENDYMGTMNFNGPNPTLFFEPKQAREGLRLWRPHTEMVNTEVLAKKCVTELDEEFFGEYELDEIPGRFGGFRVTLEKEKTQKFLEEPLIFAAKNGFRVETFFGFFHLNVHGGVALVSPMCLIVFCEDKKHQTTYRGHLKGKKFSF